MIDGLLIAVACVGFGAGWVVSGIHHTNKFNKYIERQNTKINPIFIEE